MVIRPPLEALLEEVPSKYALVVLAAKRAHDLNRGELPMVDVDSANSVSLALAEIAAGKIRYERPKESVR